MAVAVQVADAGRDCRAGQLSASSTGMPLGLRWIAASSASPATNSMITQLLSWASCRTSYRATRLGCLRFKQWVTPRSSTSRLRRISLSATFLAGIADGENKPRRIRPRPTPPLDGVTPRAAARRWQTGTVARPRGPAGYRVCLTGRSMTNGSLGQSSKFFVPPCAAC